MSSAPSVISVCAGHNALSPLKDAFPRKRGQLSKRGKTRKLQLARSLMLGSKSVSASTWYNFISCGTAPGTKHSVRALNCIQGSFLQVYAFPSAANSQTPSCPNRVSAPELRCLFAVPGSYFHRSVFNRIRSADDAALKYGRNFSPNNRRGHSAPPRMSLVEATPGVHPAKARPRPYRQDAVIRPARGRRCSSRVSSAMLVRDSRTSSATRY
jgi:hypothetical protein